jgi:hypothetical protein
LANMSIKYIYRSIRERTHRFHMATFWAMVQVGTRNTPLPVKGQSLRRRAQVLTLRSVGLRPATLSEGTEGFALRAKDFVLTVTHKTSAFVPHDNPGIDSGCSYRSIVGPYSCRERHVRP